jgi:hypothetical protein
LANLLDRLWVPPIQEQFELAVTRAMANLPRNLALELGKIIKR